MPLSLCGPRYSKYTDGFYLNHLAKWSRLWLKRYKVRAKKWVLQKSSYSSLALYLIALSSQALHSSLSLCLLQCKLLLLRSTWCFSKPLPSITIVLHLKDTLIYELMFYLFPFSLSIGMVIEPSNSWRA